MTRALGEFEKLIRALVALKEEESYGVSIRDLIERRTGRSVSAGAPCTRHSID